MNIRTYQDGPIRVIAIDRAKVRNAVNPETAKALFDAFLVFETDDSAQVAVFASTDGAFCAGFDLKAAGDGSASDWIAQLDIPDDWSDPVGDPLPGPMGPSRLMLSKPVIAAIEGPAAAGGMELALWCDMRVIAQSAFMGIYCRRWGVPLIDGGTVRLPGIVGQGRANDLILTGRRIEAAEALACGLADRLAEDGQALATALDLAHSLTRFPQGCMRADHLSARMQSADLAAALRREWVSSQLYFDEGQAGAARFSSGKGRGGDFGDI